MQVAILRVPRRMPRVRAAMGRHAERGVPAPRRLGDWDDPYTTMTFPAEAHDRPRDPQVPAQRRPLQGRQAGDVVGGREDRAGRSGGRIPRPHLDDVWVQFPVSTPPPAGAGGRLRRHLDHDALDLPGNRAIALRRGYGIRASSRSLEVGRRQRRQGRRAAGRRHARWPKTVKKTAGIAESAAGLHASRARASPAPSLRHPLRGQGYDFDGAAAARRLRHRRCRHRLRPHRARPWRGRLRARPQARHRRCRRRSPTTAPITTTCRCSPASASIPRPASRATPTAP